MCVDFLGRKDLNGALRKQQYELMMTVQLEGCLLYILIVFGQVYHAQPTTTTTDIVVQLFPARIVIASLM